MDAIQILDKNTIDQIAAGEVVDRPASIVKELVENSMDAGATAVSVEIRDGGKTLIRVTDNGSGIPSDQVGTAFLRHSTSKIRTAADLSFIHSFGFRGEALSSIAAVSRTELCTKTKDSLTGMIYRIEGGEEKSVQEAGLPDGTTVIVKDLFFNTPARLKFLKAAQTEAGYVMDLMQRLALSHPEISFKFVSNGAVRINTSGNGSLKDAIYSLFGRTIASNLLEVSGIGDSLSMQGFIGKPEIARGNRSFEFYFINGRYIKDRIVQKALEEAYTGYQMKNAFPFAVINIQMEPELVDVNVHPSKMEVRFYNNEAVYHALYEILRDRIVGRENIPSFRISETKADKSAADDRDAKTQPYVPEPFEAAAIRTPLTVQEPTVYAQQEPVAAKEPFIDEPSADIDPETQKAAIEPEQTELPFISPKAREKHRIVGEVFDTYWVVELEDKVYLIDQHAAHEKVLYERLMRRLLTQQHNAQQILPARILSFSAREEAAFRRYASRLRDFGFEIEPFGGSEYALTAVPTDLYSLDPEILLLEILGGLTEVSSSDIPEMLADRVATAACKAAVKGGNRLSYAEADALLDELLKLDNPYNCPHGRPTMISFTKYELEKRFKRIL